jgi:uncharacterized OsmC-like protein
MTTPTEIRTVLDRTVKAVTLRPSVGQGTAVTRVRLGESLSCEISDGPWTLMAGMTDKYGGDGAAPNPGVLGRAAFGSCLAIGYAMWAARLGVPITSLEIEVRADYDVRGELGVSDAVRPGYREICYIVHVSSPAGEDDVRRWIETADRCSSWRDNLANPVPLVRELHITSTASGE